MLSNTVLIFILRFGSKLLLARLLTPEDFGVFFYFLAIESILFIFIEGGSEILYIQNQGNGREQVANYLHLVSIALFSLLIGYLIIHATFFADSFESILWLLLISLSLKRLSILPFAQAKLELRFNWIAKLELVAALVSILVSVGLSVYLKSYWGLVLGYISYDVIKLFFLRSGIVFSGVKPNASMLRDFFVKLKESKFLLGARVLNQLTTKTDDILIKFSFGLNTLGLYTQAWNIMQLPIAQINNTINEVAFPQYSVIGDIKKRKELYINTLNIILYLSLPILLVFHFYATEIMVLLLGDQWEASGPILSLLAVIGVFRMLGNPGGPILLASGKNRYYYRFNLVMFLFSAIVFFVSIVWIRELTTFLYAYIILTGLFSIIFFAKINQIINGILSDYKRITFTLVLNAVLFFTLFLGKTQNFLNHWIAQVILCLGLYFIVLGFSIWRKGRNTLQA